MKHNALYIASTGPMTGKSVIALGVMQILGRQMRDMAVFRPIINEPQKVGRNPALRLLLEHFRLDQAYEDAYAYTGSEAREIINRGSRNILLENIIQKFRRLLEKYEFVCCVGTDFIGRDPVFEFELNAEIAANIGAPVLLATNGEGLNAEAIEESLRITLGSLQPYSLDVMGILVNRSQLTQENLRMLNGQLGARAPGVLVFALPNEPVLGQATMADVARGLDAEALVGGDCLDIPVGKYLVAAMHVDNFLRYLTQGQLIICAGDRTDILLAAMASRLSGSTPDIAGVLLTGGLRPSEHIMRLIGGARGTPPILLTQRHTYEAIASLQEIYGLIEPGDVRKINTLIGLFERHVDGAKLLRRLASERASERMTPMMFESEIIDRARCQPMRIVLAEGEEERILRATDILLRRQVARIILLGRTEEIRRKASALNLDIKDATLIDPLKSPRFQEYVREYHKLRAGKGITLEQAGDIMADATYFATMMVKLNDADGMVSGSINTTAHTIRPAFEFIKTKPGYSVVSSVFLMCLRDRVLVFGDCAVNPNPTARQLAEIAIASAHTARVFGIEPRVAMLSYSTGTSGKGADVDVVVEATRIAHELAPDLLLEGPLQYDAAIEPSVAATKMPHSNVAGRATVFIFPDLNTGNNTYKAVQRAAQAIAIGPVLQGLKKPVNDLSRGCTVPDIVNTVAITAVQAAAEKNMQPSQKKKG